MHALDVLGRSLDAGEDHVVALRLEMHGLIRVEHQLAGSGAGRSRQALGKHDLLGIGIERRMQQLVELVGIDALHRLLAGDEPLLGHVDGDLERGLRRALARAGLQHEQLAVLHGELDVLDVVEMRFERCASRLQLGEGFGHEPFERRTLRVRGEARRFGQGLGRAQACHHILALRIDQELAEKLVGAGGGVAREHDAGRALLAHIAEHHGLDGDGSAPIVGNIVQTTISDGARVLPGAEHGGDGAPQLGVDVLREGRAELGLDQGLEAGDDVGPILGGKLSVVFEALETFVVLQDLLEQLVVEAEHHVGIHLDEAAIGVVGEAPVARARRQALDGLIVEPQIEHGIHHAGHRGAAARPDGHEQRIAHIAEAGADDLAHLVERRAHHRLQLLGQLAAELVIDRAQLGRDGEARRHGKAEPRHLGEIGALAAQPLTIGGRAVGAAGAEGEHPFWRGS